MAIKAIGSLSGTIADVDGDRNQRIVCRNPGLSTYGAFSGVFSTGAIAATSSSGAIQWSMWNPDIARLVLISEVTVSAYVVSTITTAVAYALLLRFSSSTVLADSVNATIWGNALQTHRTVMAQSTTKIYTNGTVAGGITNGGAQASIFTDLARVDGNSGTVTGTQFFSPANVTLFSCKRAWGSYPIILGYQDRIHLRQVAAGPATGTFTIVIRVKWSEVPSGYPLIPSVANSTQLGSLANF